MDHASGAKLRSRPSGNAALRIPRESPAAGRRSSRIASCTRSRLPSSTRTMTQPPPPAPQTLAARAPCLRAAAISESISGVVMPGALVRRSFHSSRSRRSTSSHAADLQRATHRLGDVRNLLEVANDLLVAVDVLLEDLPVVDARLPRRAGVEEHEAACHLVGRDRNRLASHARRTRDESRSRRHTSPDSSPGSR